MALLLLTQAIAVVSLSAQPPDWADELDASLLEQDFSGVVLVARDGQAKFARGYGHANREWRVPNSIDTKFQLASITKTLTAVAVMQLVEMGKIRLSAPVSDYYHEAPASWNAITIEHLLTHRSGIPGHEKSTDYSKGVTQSYTPHELVAEFHAKPLDFAPGAKFKYSNPGYYLLALVIEIVSSKSYAQYLTDHVFRPAAMNDSGVDDYSAVVVRRAEGYERLDKVLQRAQYWHRSAANGAGNAYSTVEDLLRYDQALYDSTLLKRDTVATLFKPRYGSMALGWFVRTRDDRVRIEHQGSNPGFATLLRRYPRDRVLVVILSNLDGWDPVPLGDEIESLIFDGE